MTNEEALRHLTGEQIETLIKHYEIALPKKAKVSRAEKEAAVLKFAEEKEIELSDLIEEDEKAQQSADDKKEQQDKKGEGTEDQKPPASTTAEKPEEKKSAKKAQKSAPPVEQAEETEEENTGVEPIEQVEVKFLENTKFGGNRYAKGDRASFDRSSVEHLVGQKLAEIM